MTNIKSRLVYCPVCGHETESNAPTPTCPQCCGKLLTVVYSALTGTRTIPKP